MGSGYLTGVIDISINYGTVAMALKGDGTVYSWGENGVGQLGDNTTTNRYAPVQVKGVGGSGFLTNVAQISAGYYHCLVIKNDGTVYSWGYNYNG